MVVENNGNEESNRAMHVRIMSTGAKWKANENPFMYEFRVNKKIKNCNG